MKIKEFAKPVKREETIQPEESYELLGIRLDGNGLYIREKKKGSEIATKTLNKVQKGDFIYSRLFGWRGAFSIVPEKFDGLYVSSEFPTFEIDESKVNKELLLRYLLLPKTLQEVESYCIGTTKQSRNRFKEAYFLEMEVDFPGIEEQNRLNDRLANTENHVSHIKIKGEENEGLIKQLRQAILQEAIQGDLTKEWRKTNPDVEPADQRLARIQKEKERLIREGQIKKEKPLPPVTQEEKPFELPEGWVWCRLPEIGRINPTNKIEDNPLASFISMPMISAKFGVKPEFEEKEWQQIKKGYTHFQENDVAVAKITPCFENSKAAVMKGLKNGIGAGTTELHIFRAIIADILPEYVYFYFKSPHFLSTGKSKMTGSAGQKRVPKDFIKNHPFPLPPLEEQQVIVEKVNQLMTYCDELEAQVKQSQTHAEQLMEAVLQEVFEGEGTSKACTVKEV